MADEVVTTLKARIEAELYGKNAEKQAVISGRKAGELFSREFDKAVGKTSSSVMEKMAGGKSYRFNKRARAKNRADGIHWAPYLSGLMGSHPRLNTNSTFFEKAISRGNTSLFARNGQTSFGAFAAKVSDMLDGVRAKAGPFLSGIGDKARTGVSTFGSDMRDYIGTSAHMAERLKKAISEIGPVAKKALSAPFKHFQSTLKDIHRRLESFRKTLARIVLYRTIRSLMSYVKKSVQEGIENLYQYSQIFNTTFATSMDTIASSALFIKNAFAAMVAPIVDKIAPAIRNIAEYIGNAANEMAEFFTIITKGSGQQYSRAIWLMKKYKDAANETKKALDLLGIDEINRLTDNSGKGNENDYSAMFEEAISGEGGSFATSIAKAITEDDWSSVGKAIGQKFNEIVEAVKNSGFAEKLGGVVNDAVKGISGFFNEASFENVSNAIVTFLQNLNINWKGVGELWATKWTVIGDLIAGVVEGLDTSKVGQAFGDFITGAANKLTTWISDKDWVQFGRDISTKLDLFIRSIDWEGLKTALAGFFENAIKGAAQLLWGMFDEFVKSAFSVRKGSIADNILNLFNVEHSTVSSGWMENRLFNKDALIADAKANQDPMTAGGFGGKTIGNDSAARYQSQEELAKLALLDLYDDINRRASGGYVGKGDLFIANEEGPELVGTMNGRTYVGSNQDINAIGDEIQNAVYAIGNAIVTAINRKETSVVLDGDKVSRAVTTHQNLASLARG